MPGFPIVAGKAIASRKQLEDRISRGILNVEILFPTVTHGVLRNSERTLTGFRGQIKFTSFHAPSYVSISQSIGRGKQKLIFRMVHQLAELANRLSCKLLVLHSFNLVRIAEDVTKDRRQRELALLIQSLNDLVPIADEFGVTLCLENINAFLELQGKRYYNVVPVAPMDLVKVVRQFAKDAVGLCFDSAHAYNFYRATGKVACLKRVFGRERVTVPRFCGDTLAHTRLSWSSQRKPSMTKP